MGLGLVGDLILGDIRKSSPSIVSAQQMRLGGGGSMAESVGGYVGTEVSRYRGMITV